MKRRKITNCTICNREIPRFRHAHCKTCSKECAYTNARRSRVVSMMRLRIKEGQTIFKVKLEPIVALIKENMYLRSQLELKGGRRT